MRKVLLESEMEDFLLQEGHDIYDGDKEHIVDSNTVIDIACGLGYDVYTLHSNNEDDIGALHETFLFVKED